MEAADGRVVAYVYFKVEESRRQQMRRLTSVEAMEATKVMARVLQDAFAKPEDDG